VDPGDRSPRLMKCKVETTCAAQDQAQHAAKFAPIRPRGIFPGSHAGQSSDRLGVPLTGRRARQLARSGGAEHRLLAGRYCAV
jgi:hypothetical protein